MKNIIIVALVFTSSLTIAQDSRYEWKYETTIHQLLKIEEQTKIESDSIKLDFDSIYKLIDNSIDLCKNLTKKYEFNSISNRSNALRFLQAIDSILTKNQFAVCVKINTLYEGLKLTDKHSIKCVYCDFYKDYRVEHLKSFDKVYHVDCDLYSFIYLSIGEVLNLPISFVAVPKHNFVRWSFNDGTFLNWDVNTANEYDDDLFRQGKTPTVSTAFTEEDEKVYGYLKNMTQNEVLGYYYYVLGRNLKSDGKYFLAKKYYINSINKRPNNPTAKHCLAYMMVFTGAFNSKEDYLLASKFGEEAYKLIPDSKEIVETYACSLALLGNFSKAKRILKTILDYDEDLFNCFEKESNGISIYKKKHDVFD